MRGWQDHDSVFGRDAAENVLPVPLRMEEEVCGPLRRLLFWGFVGNLQIRLTSHEVDG